MDKFGVCIVVHDYRTEIFVGEQDYYVLFCLRERRTCCCSLVRFVFLFGEWAWARACISVVKLRSLVSKILFPCGGAQSDFM